MDAKVRVRLRESSTPEDVLRFAENANERGLAVEQVLTFGKAVYGSIAPERVPELNALDEVEEVSPATEISLPPFDESTAQ